MFFDLQNFSKKKLGFNDYSKIRSVIEERKAQKPYFSYRAKNLLPRL